MKNKIKIFILTFRLFFYGYFAVWSFVSFFIIKSENYNYLVQQNEAYLLSSQISSSFFTGFEENRRLKYSAENSSRLYYCGNYLNSFGVQIIKLNGNFNFIKTGERLVVTEINSSFDHPRPPPGLLT